jgi:hypothetical protein
MPSLREVYDNPATSTRDPVLLAARASTTRAAAQAFLRDLPGAQVSQRFAPPSRDHYAPAGAPHGLWLVDTLFLREFAGVNSKRGAILTAVNPNTRYAYARALVTDAGATKRGVSSAKAAAALRDILHQNAQDTADGVPPILTVRCDNGSENRGELAALLKERGIGQEFVEAGTHSRMARLDAFHRTLRYLIGDLMAATDSHVWYPHLEALVENYNSRPNQGLAAALGRKTAPDDVTPDDEFAIQLYDARRAAEVRRRTDASGVGPGSRVRLLKSKTRDGRGAFAKGSDSTWTSEVYTVEARVGPNSFLVKDALPPTWPLWALQPVSAETPSEGQAGPKIDRRVVAAQNAEFRNISGPEQAAALAAPARPRSERAVRRDYAAMARGSGRRTYTLYM